MAVSVTALLDWLMNLIRDPQAAKAFAADPEGALEKAGLDGVTTADVNAVIPVIADYAPVQIKSIDTAANVGVIGGSAGSVTTAAVDNGGSVGGNGGGGKHDGGARPDGGGKHDGGSKHDGGGKGGADDCDGGGKHDGGRGPEDDHSHAITQIHQVVNNYSYTTTIVDDRDTVIDQSVNQNIWTTGNVQQWFDNDTVIASGDGAVAAGRDASQDNSAILINDSFKQDNDTINLVDASQDNDTLNLTDNSVNDSIVDSNVGNTNIEDITLVNDSFNGNAIGNTNIEDNNVGNTNIEDNVVIADNNVGNTNIEDNVVIEDNTLVNDSFKDNEVAVGNTNIEDNNVGNTNIEDNFVVNDSLNENDLAVGNTDVDDSLILNDSLNGNEVGNTEIEDNVVVL